MSSPKKILLIDGYAVFYRSHFAFANNPLINKKGEETSVVFGFFNTLLSLIKERSFDYIACVLDAKGPTHRHEIYKEYKANRPPMPKPLREQIDFLVDLFDSLGLPYLRKQGWEADDIMGTLAKKAEAKGIEVELFTSDKDMMQVVSSTTHLLHTDRKTNAFIEDGTEKVKQKWDVEPQQIIDFLALMGDSSDNIPGVAGIGKKTAANLLNEFQSLDGIYNNIEQIKAKGTKKKLEEGREMAFLSQKLVTIDCEIKDLPEPDTLILSPMQIDDLKKKLINKEINTIIKRLRLENPGDKHSLSVIKDVSTNQEETSSKKQIKDFQRVTIQVDQLEKIFTKAKLLKHVVFDFETTSLDPITTDIVAVVFAFTDKSSYYLRLMTKDENHWESAAPLLKKLFETKSIKKIAHNIKFEYSVLQEKGIELCNLHWDTMLAAYLGDANRTHYNLENLILDYFGMTKKTYKELQGKLEDIFAIPVEELETYTYEDGEYTCRIYEDQLNDLDKVNQQLLQGIELQLVPVLAKVERNGVIIDKRRLGSIQATFHQEVEELKKQIHALAGEEFNINSTKKLQEILFEKMEIKPLKKTKTGFSTDITVLEKLAKHYPIAEAIVRYRVLSKLISTYLEALPKLIHSTTQRVHTSYNQSVAATGRLSSNHPNLQNIPIKGKEGREIRSGFVAPEGMVMASFDYSQVELRVLAQLSQDKNLLGAYKQGKDIHHQTSELLFPGEEVTSDRRRIAKTINFSVMYGISPYALSEDLKVTTSEAKSFIDGYFEAYPGVRKYIDEVIETARKNRFVKTHYGRKRHVPDITASNFNLRSRAERVAFNSIIQGTASDVIKLAMIGLHKKINTGEIEGEMVMQVHDELVFYLPKGKEKKHAEIIKQAMVDIEPFHSILEVGENFGENWGKE